MSVYKSYPNKAALVAAWKAGAPRYGKVDGWTIDAVQAERDLAREPEPVEVRCAECGQVRR